jgi:hypothetical protein
MCGIDGRVAKEVSKREARDAYGFWGGGLSVNVSRLAVEVGAVAAAASLAVALSALLKVLWGSLSISQVGWVRDDILQAHFTVLLSSSRCASWYFRVSSGAWTFSTGSQVLSLSRYPLHLIRYWSLWFWYRWAQIASTSYRSSPSIISGGGLV